MNLYKKKEKRGNLYRDKRVVVIIVKEWKNSKVSGTVTDGKQGKP